MKQVKKEHQYCLYVSPLAQTLQKQQVVAEIPIKGRHQNSTTIVTNLLWKLVTCANYIVTFDMHSVVNYYSWDAKLLC